MHKIKIIGFESATLPNDYIGLFDAVAPVEKISVDNFLEGAYDDTDRFAVAVVRDRALRHQLINELDQRRLKRATLIHHSCVIDRHANIGEGCIISQFSSALWQSHIDNDCLIAPYCMVAHQSHIGQGSIMQPGAMIAGSTKVGAMCMMQMRSCVLDHIQVCDWVEIGPSAMITKNITNPGRYLGQPARRAPEV